MSTALTAEQEKCGESLAKLTALESLRLRGFRIVAHGSSPFTHCYITFVATCTPSDFV